MKIKYILLAILAVASANFFLSTHFSALPIPVAAFSLFSLFYIPGFLTLLILKVHLKNIWMILIQSLGISITWIYILGIVASYLMPGIGFQKPLALYPFAFVHFGLVIILFGIALIRNWHESLSGNSLVKLFFRLLAVVLSVTISSISIIGAFTLNNGGANTITLVWLVFLVMVFFAISLIQNKKYDFLRPYIILTLSLSLLWALSARSWHLIGWDIIGEFIIAKATALSGKWSPRNVKDAYNSCLSLTILPTVLSNLTSFSIENIFKFVYPFIFAQFPISVYFFLKKIGNKNLAFLSVLYILAQSFFIQPMVALARQEIAFFFFSLLLLTMISTVIKNKAKTFLILIYIFAMVTSHYSTTYVTIILFSLVYAAVLSISVIKHLPISKSVKERYFYIKWISTFSSSLKWWIVLSLVLFSYIWFFLITQSAGNVTLAVSENLSNMTQMFKGDQKSTEVKQALPGASSSLYTTQSDLNLFQQTNNIVEGTNNLPMEKIKEISLKYPIVPVKEQLVGPIIEKNIASDTAFALDKFKDLLKFLLILGTFFLLLKSFFKNYLNLDSVLFCGVSTLLLLIVILHPTLGLNYNISRIYLQLLVFLSYSLIIGLDTLLFFLAERIRLFVIGLIIVVSFFYLQGIFVPVIGGTPIVQYYNFGTDYEKFYVFQGELNGARWLADNRNFSSTVYADDLTGLRLRKEANFFPNTTIIPDVIANNAHSYVYTSNTNKNLGKAEVNFNNKFLTYTYPIKFLDDKKNLIYSNGNSSIYK